jgi:hypothetical protein
MLAMRSYNHCPSKSQKPASEKYEKLPAVKKFFVMQILKRKKQCQYRAAWQTFLLLGPLKQ